MSIRWNSQLSQSFLTHQFKQLIQHFQITIVICTLSIVCFLSSAAFLPTPDALASIHTYQEQPGQTTFRSKQSLRDRRDRSWQVILFKRYQEDTLQGLYLRLIGFPGIVTVAPDQPITIETGASLQWQAVPTLDPQTPSLPDYANQYDIADTIQALSGDIPLDIKVPLAGNSTADLVIPPFAVHEWRDLSAQIP